jgi:hypothetical protein
MLMENNTFTNALIVVINLEEQKEAMILKAFLLQDPQPFIAVRFGFDK